MGRLVLVHVLLLAIVVSGCAVSVPLQRDPDPYRTPAPAGDGPSPGGGGGVGAWLDEHPVMETVTIGLAVVGAVALAGLAAAAISLASHHSGGMNWGP